jgi:hypothetical protein
MGKDDMLSIKQYDLEKLKTPSTMAIFGKHGTGKSTFIKWVLYYIKDKIRLPIVVSESADSSGDFEGKVPDTLIFNEYIPSKFEIFIKEQKKLNYLKHKLKHKKYIDKKIGSVVVMDDILGDSKWDKDKNLSIMFFNGRHLKTTLILGIQQVMGLKKKFRGDLDYTVITKLTTEQGKEDVYKYYWNSSFGTKKDCINIINKCTKGHRVLIIDQKKVATSNSIGECVFYLDVPHPDKIPRFKIGSKSIWYLHYKKYNSNWEKDEIWPSKSKYKKYKPIKKNNKENKIIRKVKLL